MQARRAARRPALLRPIRKSEQGQTRPWGDCLAVTLSRISISHLRNTVPTIDCSREIIGSLALCLFVVLRLDTGHVATIIGLDLLVFLPVMLLLAAEAI